MRLLVPTDVIEAARTGNRADIERLLEAVWPDAYRLARAIVPQRHAAEDAAQEACVIMFRSIASLREAAAFGSWFYRIVVREALKQKKLQTSSALAAEDAAHAEDLADTIDLWRALAALPATQRAVVVLYYFERLSSREIGGILNIPNATVRFRLMTARRRLQHLLQDTESTAQAKGEEIYAL